MVTIKSSKRPRNAHEALKFLEEGNQRFSMSKAQYDSSSHQDRRVQLLETQNPFSIILSCSDSRVPSEIIFDQSLGDLFIIRVAGNIVAPTIIGSIEFAVTTFETPLVVVMGHSQCGAVTAAIDGIQTGRTFSSENIKAIINRISPAILPVIENSNKNDLSPSREELLKNCVRANTLSSVLLLRQSSKIIEKLILENKLLVIGAEYSLESGQVHFMTSSEENEFNLTQILNR